MRKTLGSKTLGLLVGLLTLSRLAAAQASESVGHYPLPDSSDIVGRVQTVETSGEETLIDIGLRHGVGYNAMVRANPETNVWVPGEGTEVVVPTRYILPPGPHEGIVVNLAEMRLYYYPDTPQGKTPRVETYPIGIGRMDWQTPLGRTTVTAKVENPAWYPPQSIIAERAKRGETLPSVVPPGPDNPLGKHALILDLPGYLIHGTNRPAGVGMRVSHGCIRMLPGDIADLIHRVPVGTPVRLVKEPVKFGWDAAGILHVQAYPAQVAADDGADAHIAEAMNAATRAASGRRFLVDYRRLKEQLEAPDGMPTALLLAGRPFPLPEPVLTFFERAQLIPSLYSRVATSPAGKPLMQPE
ncbi:L,D-transpeptidase family protein [Halomonas sp. HP20-15]|uniref:L,D-transpeptidase family protein n=1 Tax=Halomonas sp. HP20-15 TaxID=3085901 RepID=UPI002980C723|nr:L,D-transpeptidase family protein [Halomonas sp. HP20-15]MDW5378272.1 L,D-transpeptidase family protein [Halomonas sp. HP20-15]